MQRLSLFKSDLNCLLRPFDLGFVTKLTQPAGFICTKLRVSVLGCWMDRMSRHTIFIMRRVAVIATSTVKAANWGTSPHLAENVKYLNARKQLALMLKSLALTLRSFLLPSCPCWLSVWHLLKRWGTIQFHHVRSSDESKCFRIEQIEILGADRLWEAQKRLEKLGFQKLFCCAGDSTLQKKVKPTWLTASWD